MTLHHRQWHCWAWIVLGPIIVGGLWTSLVHRRPESSLIQPAPGGFGDSTGTRKPPDSQVVP